MTGERSVFVTVVSWFLIVGSALNLLGAIGQIVIVMTVLSDELGHLSDKMPALGSFIFRHIGLLSLGMLLAAAAMLAASIGLLKRRNWARRLVIAFLGVGILYLLGSVVGVSFFLPPSGEGPPQFRTFNLIIYGMANLAWLGIAGVQAWLIWKLTTPAIRREFLDGSSPGAEPGEQGAR